MERLVQLIQGEEPLIRPNEEDEFATAAGAAPSDRQKPVEEDEDNLIEEI